MSIDGKILARAKDRLDKARRNNEKMYEVRRADVFAAYPDIQELDSEIRASVIDAIGHALSGGRDPAAAIEEIGEHNLLLKEERSRALISVGLPADYITYKPACQKCGDTGYNGLEICSCLMELYKKEQKKELSLLLNLGTDTFDTFDIMLYDDTPDPVTGISPRSSMEAVYEICVEYSRKFPENSCNLFFYGSTGLGKTFLSSCIAKVVSERGFSVVYDTAGSVFAKYEEAKFSRGDDVSAARADISRYEKCDLLIIDDLGTELATSFVTSALYTLINTRLVSGKKTIISSNLSIKELRSRYSPAVMSRLEGEFTILPFYGSDIRLKKTQI